MKGSPSVLFEELYEEDPYGFIYESLEDKEDRGRYSFIGAKPFAVFYSKADDLSIQIDGETFHKKGDPFRELKVLINGFQGLSSSRVFTGGAVGYISYDAIRMVEKIPDKNPDDITVPDIFFILPSELIVFDHKEEMIEIIIYHSDVSRFKEIEQTICSSSGEKIMSRAKKRIDYIPYLKKEAFCDIVRKAKEYIYAGDIFQVVLSQRFAFPVEKDPIEFYKRLRLTNPSPYMYYLKLKDLYVVGSSPETLVKVDDNKVISRPIAGTRPRGRTLQQDKDLAYDLLNDEKEKAEHIMLVDLARNDLGRVCKFGSIKVTDFLQVERFSRVMHLSSNVTGDLREGCNSFDVLRAAFPAGTVTGAPKIRAMEIIDELESVKRGIYAGAIGYFGFNKGMEFCIAIRTIIICGNTGYIQAGAGIVADSVPIQEYNETLNKLSALQKAIEDV